jgi:adenylate cyclase
MSSEPDQDYFSDGITEDIITELSRFSGLFVIARNSSFAYKNHAVKIQEVGAELGVRYVVEGSVRKSQDRVRVTVQLIESETGIHVWADRYDRQLLDIFDVQDELTEHIVATLSGRVDAAEKRRLKRRPPKPMAALDYLLAGRIHHHRVTKEDNAEAIRLLEKAIQLDPEFAEAHAWKACALGQALEFGFSQDADEIESQAINAVTFALSLDEDNVECHRLLCEVCMESLQLDQAMVHGARAIALNPNDPRLVAQQGESLTWAGRAEEGVELIERSMRLDPHGKKERAHLLGRALYCAKRYTDALTAFNQITAPRYDHCATMAACHGQLAKDTEAELFAIATLNQKSDFSIEKYANSLPFAEQVDRVHVVEGLRKGGLPE